MIDASINPNIDRIAMRLKTIPENPGVYQHLDADGKVIYVGKARNLQRRVSSYFSHYDDKSPKIKMLVRSVCDIRVTVVATEVDALLLENSLIKRYQPRYNSMLKDDKTYPYLCITDEEYPRLLYTRRHTIKGQYFGPYPNGRILRELQDIIRQLFQYRTCNIMGSRPCMKHQIGLCGAPCAGRQSKEEYQAVFDNIRRILKGDFGDILDDLKRQMYALAEQLRFEEAESVKRKIRLLEEYQSRSTVVDTNVRDVDVVSILGDERYAYVNFMRVKHGAIIYSISNEIKKQLDESDEEILATVIPALHEQTQSTATEVVLPMEVADLPSDYLKQTADPRGDRRKLLELSLRNVESYQKQCRHQRALTQGDAAPQAVKLLERLQRALQLPQLPMDIECFDNSHISGAYPVAGMVRFTAGKPNRKEYRKFNLATTNDDYASMAEVITRRYSRLHDEGQPLPDLLIVDGGEGQMHIARQVIEEKLDLHIPIAGLAKDDRHRTNELLRFDSRGDIAVVQLKPTDPLFHLMEQIQNEVHRFAVTFHKDKRSKGTFRTALTDIPGIGEKTAHDLLLRFGSVKQIQLQNLDDLTAAIGPAKAELVYNHLHNGE
ncbi:MAG: excinuclease ABC subunit UvrC [Bacteroidales bacterium]|nr:excinuclease ABC subunit UvrC [Bacteroidales bacterium]